MPAHHSASPSVAVADGFLSGWADAARRLQPSAQSPSDRQLLSDFRRPDPRVPKTLVRLVEIAAQAPSLADALAPARAMERAILAAHPTTLHADLVDAHVAETHAQADGDIAAALLFPSIHATSLERYVDACERHETALVVARYAAIRKAAQQSARTFTLVRGA